LTICKPQPPQAQQTPPQSHTGSAHSFWPGPTPPERDRTRSAEIHPHNTLQVITEKHVPDRDLGRNRLRFYTSRQASDAETERGQVPPAIYSSRPARAPVDLVQHPRQSGGLSNVATVLIELGDLDGAALGRIAAARGKATARRLGWLLEHHRPDVDLVPLRIIARPQEGAPTLLSASGVARGSLDRSWGLRLNTDVQPDT
jgi:predicted transcriptional regulator of viral defense system